MEKMPTYEELLSENQSMLAEVQELKQEQSALRHRIMMLERLLFGSRKDRLKPNVTDVQPGLFDGFFKEAMEEKAAEIENTAKTIEKDAQKRRESARKTPSRPARYQYCGLEERERTINPEGIDLSDCVIIGRDVTRTLHYENARVWVDVAIRPIYRKKSDKGLPNPRIYQAEATEAVIGGNHVGADMLANIIIDKYRYHLPEYRQVKQYADMGVKLPASTVNDWVHAVAAKLDPVYEAQRQEVLQSGYLQIDEVPWNIIDRPGKQRKGYAWQFYDSRPGSHGLYFLYLNGSRAGTIPRAELRDYKGSIQTDGYGVYDYFEQQENVTLLGCMAHVRRKFVEAQTSHPQLAEKAVHWISLLYTLEANLKAEGAAPERVEAERKAKALPIMDAMEEWMKAVSSQCTPSDPMGKALDYAYKLWPRLRRYADNGIYQIDNNAVERNQRPTVMGRKNYLFSKNDKGAVDNAILYTLLESCDIVGINPLDWLTYVLDNLHSNTPPEQIRQLLPYYYKKSRV